jgi:hypothetical protein
MKTCRRCSFHLMGSDSFAASPSRTPYRVGGHVRSDVLFGSSSRATNGNTRFARNAMAHSFRRPD